MWEACGRVPFATTERHPSPVDVFWCCVKSLYLVVFGINLREKVSQKPLRVVCDNSASDASEIPRTALKPKGLPPETVGSLVEASEWALWVLSASEGGYSLLAGSLSLRVISVDMRFSRNDTDFRAE